MAEASEPAKPRPRRQKRKKVQAGDGWTVVTHTSGAKGSDGEETDMKQLQDAKPTTTVSGLTVENLLVDFKRMEKTFHETECSKDIVNILQKRKWHIAEAVCIGIGSFSLDWENRWRSLWQLVLFLAVVETVSTKDAPIQLYGREPLFTSLDEAFLSSLPTPISVFSTDEPIQSHICTSTFVFAPFVDRQILLPIFLSNKDPTLYVGNEVLDDYSLYKKAGEKTDILEECNSIGKSFLEGRKCVKLGKFEAHVNALTGLVLYWKEQDQDSAEN